MSKLSDDFDALSKTTPVASPLSQQFDDAAATVDAPEATTKATLKIAPNKLKGSVAGGTYMGLRDSIDAGAQILRRVIPDGIGETVDEFGNLLASYGLPVTPSSGVAGVDSIVQNADSEYNASRALAGRSGIDVSRIAGNIVNPVNRIIPGAGAASRAGVAVRSAGQGTISGVMTPTTDTDNFWGNKLGQAILGGGAGAVIGTAANEVGNALLKAFSRAKAAALPYLSGEGASLEANQIIARMAKTQGMDLSALPQSILQSVQSQVSDALRAGQSIDAAALLRKAQADSIGAKLSLGQMTRDPSQFTREQNLRGIEGAGEPLMNLFNTQNAQLIGRMNQAGAEEAPGAFAASQGVIKDLMAKDASLKASVNAAYEGARNSQGRYATLDVPAFSKAANDALDSGQLGHFLPDNVRNLLNDISGGKIPLNVNTATQIDSVLSTAQRSSADKAGAKAIGVIRDALNKAPVADQLGADALKAFQNARSLAKQRFDLHDAVPAMKDALEGAQPDNFFQKYVLGGTVKDLEHLTDTLSPESNVMLRNQLIDHLKQSALGGASDEVGKFSQSAYNKTLNKLGDKLSAFFTPEEIGQLKTVGKVASYQQVAPAGAAVNSSNTAAAAMNLFAKLSGTIGGLPYIKEFAVQPVRNFANRSAANAAANPQVKPQIEPELIRRMRGATVPFGGNLGAAIYQNAD